MPAPGGPILEKIQPGGVITRFDKRHNYFGAYDPGRHDSHFLHTQ